MPPKTPRSRLYYWALIVLVISVLFRGFLSRILFVTFGIGRVVQPIEDFPWDCTRIHHPLLESCEHMWLDHDGRKLYGACGNVASRLKWCPGGNNYNVSGRAREDHITVLDIDHPGPDGLYGLRQLHLSGFDGDLDLHGFDVQKIAGSDTLRFWLINHRPPIDPSTGHFLDGNVVGANSTIEVFDLNDASEALQYVKTIASDAIIAPNSLAISEDGMGAVITNDHDTKVGRFRDLEMLYGSGSLAYCRFDSGKCDIAASKSFAFPNGIVRDRNGFYYVANSLSGSVTVHIMENDRLVHIDSIPLGYPIDNLSIDTEGSLFAAALPDFVGFVKSAEDPYRLVAPATVLSVNGLVGKREIGANQYNVSKVAEDKDGKALPSITIAVHDVESRQLFLGGIFSPFLGVCKHTEP